ncbi:MAG: DUF4037 domain-containing protein [Caldilineaceae bacterium]|nr:DUF4037 domain-containing protein [Caldilineaceae bacterium]
MGNAFLPGLKLGEAFYAEAVRPLLDETFPGLPHAAALIGSGSEILGFDDEMSTDHHYGPRVMLFLADDADPSLPDAIRQMLADRLPYRFRGYPTSFTAPNPDDNGVQLLEAVESGPVNHRVEIFTVPEFMTGYLGIDLAQPLTPDVWLALPQQRLRTTVGGAVYHDEVGLEAVRQRLAWYPRDVWLYLLAAGWARIGQEEHLMGRAGYAGDEIGSALIGARLVRDVMRLCFLMERTYAPYPKWFGTAFRQLACGPELAPVLEQALHAQSWQAREEHLAAAYETLGRLHNRLDLTERMPEQVRDFFGRPFRVMALHGFSDALARAITDPAVQAIARRPLIGNVDLVSDNTDLLENNGWQPILRTLYRP